MAPPSDDEHPPNESADTLGPEGGRTTGTRHLIRRTVYIDRDVDQKVRERAYETRETEAAVIREALRVYFGIE